MDWLQPMNGRAAQFNLLPYTTFKLQDHKSKEKILKRSGGKEVRIRIKKLHLTSYQKPGKYEENNIKYIIF